MMKIYMTAVGDAKVLAGAVQGRQALGKLIAQLPSEQDDSVVALDFEGIELATASFLRESVLGFRDYCRSAHSAIYPIVANANEQVLEELDALLAERADSMVSCIASGENFTGARVLGRLDPKLRRTLEAIIEAGEADAGELKEAFAKTEDIGTTGWNNRLAALAAKGVIMEIKFGRGKRYRPVVEGLSSGY